VAVRVSPDGKVVAACGNECGIRLWDVATSTPRNLLDPSDVSAIAFSPDGKTLASAGREGTASWSLSTLQRTLRVAPDGLPKVSTYAIRLVLRESWASYQRPRSWCPTGEALRRRKAGPVVVADPDSDAKKMIEAAYLTGEAMRLAVWCTDQAGP
jgi:hypothetical protein